MTDEPRYPYVELQTHQAPGGRVAVTVSVSGPAVEQYPTGRYTRVTITGALAVRDTFAEAVTEAVNHPATQEALRAFDAGPVMVDSWGKPVRPADRT